MRPRIAGDAEISVEQVLAHRSPTLSCQFVASPAATIEPFIKMCQECANVSESCTPASSASRRTAERMYCRWAALACPSGLFRSPISRST